MPDTVEQTNRDFTKLLVTTFLIILTWAVIRFTGGQLYDKPALIAMFILVAFVRPLLEIQVHKRVQTVKGLFNVFTVIKLLLLWMIWQVRDANGALFAIVGIILFDSMPWLLRYGKALHHTFWTRWFHHGDQANFQGGLIFALILDGLAAAAYSIGFSDPLWMGFAIAGAALLMGHFVGGYGVFIAVGAGVGVAYGFPSTVWLIGMGVYWLFNKSGVAAKSPFFAVIQGGKPLLGYIIVFGVVLLVVLYFFGPQLMFYVLSQGLMEDISYLGGRLKGAPEAVTQWFGRQYDRGIKAAAGDYYLGQVDSNSDKRLGVFLDEWKPAQSKFYLDSSIDGKKEPVILYGVISAESLESEDCRTYDDALRTSGDRLYASSEQCETEQRITLSCGVKDTKITGIVIPSTIDVYDIDGVSEGFDCEIPVEQLTTQLSDPIEVQATFPFTTKAYYKMYFIDDLRKRDLRRANIDVLDFYQIRERAGVQHYTNGPVMVGFGAQQELPISVRGDDRPTSLGVTIDRRWNEGEIKSVRELCIISPQGVEIECPLFDTISMQEARSRCSYSGEGQRVAVLSETQRKRLQDEVDSSQTYHCRITPDKSILREVPIVTKFFKVTLKYDYTVSRLAGVRLRDGDGIIADELATCTTLCDDPDGCYCPSTKDCTTPQLKVDKGRNCNGKYEEISGRDIEVVPVEQRCIHFNSCEDYDKFEKDEGFFISVYESWFGTLPTTAAQQQRDSAQQMCFEDMCELGCRWDGEADLCVG